MATGLPRPVPTTRRDVTADGFAVPSEGRACFERTTNAAGVGIYPAGPDRRGTGTTRDNIIIILRLCSRAEDFDSERVRFRSGAGNAIVNVQSNSDRRRARRKRRFPFRVSVLRQLENQVE